MVVFLCCHIGKDICGIRMMFPQSFCEIGIDSAVLFLAADRKGENFWLGQIVKVLQGLTLFREVLRIILNRGELYPVKPAKGRSGPPAGASSAAQPQGGQNMLSSCPKKDSIRLAKQRTQNRQSKAPQVLHNSNQATSGRNAAQRRRSRHQNFMPASSHRPCTSPVR